MEAAFIVRLSAVSPSATVSNPLLSIPVPDCTVPVMLQVTVWAGLFFPVTLALNCCVPPLTTLAVVGDMVTDSTVVNSVTVTVVLADFVLSSAEVAVTVNCVAVSPSATVNSPASLMAVPLIPPVTDHATFCDGLFSPVTVALNCCVLPFTTVTSAGLIVTLVTVAGVPMVTLAVPAPVTTPSVFTMAVTVRPAAVSPSATVSKPLPVIVVPFIPPVTLHSTVSPLSAPFTVKLFVPPLATVVIAGEIVMLPY